MEDKPKLELSRRNFISGLAVSAMAITGLSACAANKNDASADSKGIDSANATPENISETIDADIVVVGAGISGLACAVQAAQDGNKVLVLESSSVAGGNGLGVEGIFAVNSSLQQASGIHIDPVDVASAEAEQGQYRADGSLWISMIESSADNIEWLIEQGVEFTGVVDNYHTGLYPTMHWFKDQQAAVGYIPHMQTTAEELGAEIRLSTRGTKLIVENGIVKGLYAETEDGNAIKINAKAVIIATGGIGNNKELLAKQGWEAKVDELVFQGIPSVQGDGYNMAMEAGAHDFLPYSADLSCNFIKAFGSDMTPPYDSPLNSTLGLASGGPVLWVNQAADRFVDESILHWNMQLQGPAIKGNRATYSLFDQTVLDAYIANSPEDAKIINDGLIDDGGESIFAADTIEELAAHFELDAEELRASIERYNTYCKDGKDLDFGKNAQFLKPIEKKPLYIAKIDSVTIATIGAITTNKWGEALDKNKNPIPGLYAIGLDGTMLYRNIYTINMPGTCCGNGVNTGRKAAQKAKEYIGQL